jgi:hypothetical protein
MGCWQALAQHRIQQTQTTSWKWRKMLRKGNCTEWPRFTTFWRCCRAAKTYVLHRRHLVLNISRWLPLATFQTWKRSSTHPGHSFNMMVRLHLNGQKDHLCDQLCLRRTSTNSIPKCPPNQRINRHPVDSDEDSIPESILDTQNSLSWDGDLDNPNDSEDDCASDVESHI